VKAQKDRQNESSIHQALIKILKTRSLSELTHFFINFGLHVVFVCGLFAFVFLWLY